MHSDLVDPIRELSKHCSRLVDGNRHCAFCSTQLDDRFPEHSTHGDKCPIRKVAMHSADLEEEIQCLSDENEALAAEIPDY